MHIVPGWMFRLGGFLILLGGGSLLLPMIGLQFKVVAWADSAQPFLGIGLLVAGIALLVFGFTRGREPSAADGLPAQQHPHPATDFAAPTPPASFQAPQPEQNQPQA